MKPKSKTKPLRINHGGSWTGVSQLSLVEHALCPANPKRRPFIHQTKFTYQRNRRRQIAEVEVNCPRGLFPNDEFYLWGLLALTFRQPEPSVNFYASARYCLRELGCTEGGKQVSIFRDAIERLAHVSYFNPHFYDPTRREHRRAVFGFLSYESPTDDRSLRAWHIGWDPVFFKFVQASGGYLAFDLETYRALSHASRRLFLYLKKLFYRKPTSPTLNVRDLSVDVLGYAPSLPAWEHTHRVLASAKELAAKGILDFAAKNVKSAFTKTKAANQIQYTVQFRRGDYFDKKPDKAASAAPDSLPNWQALHTIGLAPAAIQSVLARYKPALIERWVDVTLARKEQGLPFTRSPAAFFMNNLKEAAAGRRTPPDWYLELEKKRQQLRHANVCPETTPESENRQVLAFIKGEGRDYFENTVQDLFQDFQRAGDSPQAAHKKACKFTFEHVRKKLAHEGRLQAA